MTSSNQPAIDCFNAVNAVLQENTLTNSQFPFLLWDENSCQGTRFPTSDEFPLFSQYLSADILGMSTIQSLYIPPHCTLQLYAPTDGYFQVSGPSIIPVTDAHLGFWTYYDDRPCEDNSVDCGKKVNWSFGSQPAQINRLRVVFDQAWVDLLNQRGSFGQPIALNNTVYDIDYDAFFDENCTNGNNAEGRFGCNCRDAYELLLFEQPEEVANQSYVNLLQNGCNANLQFMPTGSNVGVGSKFECQEMIKSQLANGTFPTIDRGGPDIYVCAGESYVNVYSDGSRNMLEFADDKEEVLRELEEMNVTNSNTPDYAYYVLAALLIFATLLLLTYYLNQQRGFSKEYRYKKKRKKYSVEKTK